MYQARQQQQGRRSTSLLAHLFLLLLPIFAALAGSVASSHAHLIEHDPVVQVSAPSPVYQDTDGALALLSCGDTCITMAECGSDGTDDSAILRVVHALPVATIDSAASPAHPIFSFLRDRTSAPRAPPAQA